MNQTLDLTQSLPPLQRLALAYSPGHVRSPTLALLALDSRLADIVHRASEPMLAQIKLAWWRDLLRKEPGQWPKGEPLVALLHHWQLHLDALIALVDGWELCVGGDGDQVGQPVRQLADARGQAFAALAELLDQKRAAPISEKMGREWALADQAAHLPHPADRETARDLLAGQTPTRQRLPRPMRTLCVLHALAAHSIMKGTDLDRLGPASLLVAMRAGLFGL